MSCCWGHSAWSGLGRTSGICIADVDVDDLRSGRIGTRWVRLVVVSVAVGRDQTVGLRYAYPGQSGAPERLVHGVPDLGVFQIVVGSQAGAEPCAVASSFASRSVEVHSEVERA